MPAADSDESDESLDELIRAIAAGDEDAFSTLVNRYEARLRRLAASLVGDATEAEDIAQDTFLKVLRSASQFRGKGSARGWLFRIATHTALDRLRRTKRLAEVPLRAEVETGPSDSADRGWEQQQQARQIWDGLSKLTPENRSVLVLREIEGLSYREISEILDCPVGTVLSRVHRARRQLADLLTE